MGWSELADTLATDRASDREVVMETKVIEIRPISPSVDRVARRTTRSVQSEQKRISGNVLFRRDDGCIHNSIIRNLPGYGRLLASPSTETLNPTVSPQCVSSPEILILFSIMNACVTSDALDPFVVF